MKDKSVVFLSSLMGLFIVGVLHAENPIKMDSMVGARFDGSKPECAKLRGTARIHCEIGSDPHLGAMPVVVDAKRDDPNAEDIKRLESEIKRLDEAIDYYREELNEPSDEDDLIGKRRATELTMKQRNILDAITGLTNKRDALVRELADKRKSQPSKGGSLPADSDCVRNRYRSIPKDDKAVPVPQAPEQSQPQGSDRLPEDYDCVRHWK